jgi:hypothetical protein
LFESRRYNERHRKDEQSDAREAAVAFLDDGWVTGAARVIRNVMATSCVD